MTITELPSEAHAAIDEIRLIGGDELVRELMVTFLQCCAAPLPRLHEAAETGELETGSRIAHTLKASARQLGAISFGDACASAELAAKGGDVAGFLHRADDAAGAFERTRPWMQRLSLTVV